MLRCILAGLAAGALWGLVFVAPRMVAGYSSVDLTAGRFVAYGLVALAVMLLGLAIRDAGTAVPTLVIGDSRWPSPAETAACALFTLGILASIKAHR